MLLVVGAVLVAGGLALLFRRLRIQLHKAATRTASLRRTQQSMEAELKAAVADEHQHSLDLISAADSRLNSNITSIQDQFATEELRSRGHRAWLEATQERIASLDTSFTKRLAKQESSSRKAVQQAADHITAVEARSGELDHQVDLLNARHDEFANASVEFGELHVALVQRQNDVDQQQADLGRLHADLGQQLTSLSQRQDDLANTFAESRGPAPEVLEALDRYQRNETVLRRKAKTAEDKLSDLSTQTNRLRRELHGLQIREYERGVLDGRPPALPPAASQAFVPLAVSHQSLPAALHLIRQPGIVQGLNLTKLRELYRFLQKYGYWRDQHTIVKRIADLSGNESDAAAVKRLGADMAMFAQPLQFVEGAEPDDRHRDEHGPVLHVVGKSLPLTQTGYTLRTQYTARAQQDLGIPVAVAVQPGGDALPEDGATEASFVNDGITYHRLAGPPRAELPLDQWLALYVASLGELIRECRPSVLHAHSDFLNGAAAVLAGRTHGIPVVYESRGFWEESWLSRVVDTLSTTGGTLGTLETLGLPDAYSLRQGAEQVVRQHADAIVTLAEVMKAHIQNHNGSDLPSVTITPNAVDTQLFSPAPRNQALAAELGIGADECVVGYISSMVEYEGVDTLIEAMGHLRQNRGSEKLRLVLVGDGPILPRLKSLAEPLGNTVIFVGRVPHEDVQHYYSLIDIFVIPRRPTQVSQLVTPLKPFEAMAMGKAVAMSDVEALREIAQDSDAVRLFRAGDANDLATVLSKLIDDPVTRSALGAAAREWVATERTWARNASICLSLYNRLGARWNVSSTRLEAQDALRNARVDPFAVVKRIQETEPPTQGWFAVGEPRSAERIMAEGWQFAQHPPVMLDQITDWGTFVQRDRSLAFNIHAWDFVDSFVWNEREPSEAETRYLMAIIQSWNADRLSRVNSGEDTMAYYDMSLALRAARLPHVIVLANSFDSTRGHVPELVHLMFHERAELRRPEAFNPRTNHGFYTAAAQLHLEKYVPGLPEHDEVEHEALERMAQLLQTQFADDGGHLEHSPEYHKMLLASLSAAVDSELITDERMVATIARGRAVLGWMIQPNGDLVPLGDSQQRPISKASALGEPTTLWISTDGKLGHPAEEEMLALPSSGYAFVRSPQPQVQGARMESSYLAVQAGFHSRAHKHADDLSFVWFDRGQEICIDAGRYGYGELLAPDDPQRADGFYYSGRERQYVESSRAHNTIEVDGVIQNRRREPYGSALVETAREGAAFAVTGRATHETFTHRRKINMLPRTRLTVLDSLFSKTTDQRSATAWFLLDGSLKLLAQEERALRFELPSGETLLITTDEPISDVVRGQDSPLRGWRSRRTGDLEPAWSFGVNLTFEIRGGIRTDFSFEG
ncbi:glycosyltransferase [Ornithinimicrobium faecis]|uniref:glycosyltransferase n=1 Tax=Ornithinimicrobium faecis TaxID=2934158 RepID=UPI002117C30C|nr:glycosyltransferase [Ornithinimicrobium sp. HY1745]